MWTLCWQVSVRQAKGNKELDLLVMENLLYARNVSRLYDLKGSVRSRYNSDLTGNNKVLLDENLLEMMPTSPIFVSNKAKRLLERAVWNDTAFLAVSKHHRHSLFCVLHDYILREWLNPYEICSVLYFWQKMHLSTKICYYHCRFYILEFRLMQ